jgi:chromosome segregation ATPase
MTNGSSDRLDRIEALLQQSVIASDERMTRLEQSMLASDERMTRIEQGLERVERVVESNNRFLESFSTDLRRYTDAMNNLTTRIDGVIATNNQDRQESNSRLAVIQRQVAAIAKHLGVM